jgi:hypothetical protein
MAHLWFDPHRFASIVFVWNLSSVLYIGCFLVSNWASSLRLPFGEISQFRRVEALNLVAGILKSLGFH